MAVEKFTISRDDSVYEAFPDLCLTDSGRVLLVYRESNGHVASEFCRLVVRSSDDAGRTWSERRVVREEDRSSGVLTAWNCPKIQQLQDGRVVLTCDKVDFPPGEWGHGMGSPHNALWFSEDEGRTWSEPVHTPVGGITPDKITELPDGRWLLPTSVRHEETGQVLQQITSSPDGGQSWGAPVVICEDRRYEMCEASVVTCPGGELVVYLRENSGQRRPLQKMISTDGGATWEGPHATLNPAAQGMPVAGLTRDDLVLVTGRFTLDCDWRVDDSEETMQRRLARRSVVIPQVPANEDFVAGLKEDAGVVKTGTEVISAMGRTSIHTFAFIEPLASALEPDVDSQRGLLLPLDLDNNNLGADSGYTGWVEYEPGRFLVAAYINADAPLAQIRGYRFGLEDF